MMRILSLFNVLKRVGFAVLFVLTVKGYAQLDSVWVNRSGFVGVDDANSIIVTEYGCLLVGGYRNEPSSHGYLTKLTIDGDTIWDQNFDSDSGFFSVDGSLQLSDGNYVIGGKNRLSSTYRIVLVDSLGNSIWTVETGYWTALSPKVEFVETQDRNLLVVQSGGGSNQPDIHVMLLHDGEVQWSRDYGGQGIDRVLVAKEVIGDGYLIGGCTDVIENGEFKLKAFVQKLDYEGHSEWTSFIAHEEGDLWISDGVIDGENNVFLAGFIEIEATFTTFPYIARISPFGDVVWQEYSSATGSGGIYSIASYTNQEFIACGGSEGHFMMLSFDTSGQIAWQSQLYELPHGEAASMIVPISNRLCLAGGTNDIEGNDALVAAFHYLGAGLDPNPEFVVSFRLRQNFPNPFNSGTTIEYDIKRDGYYTLSVFDILGRRSLDIDAGLKTAGTYTAFFSPLSNASGSYLITLSDRAERQSIVCKYIK